MNYWHTHDDGFTGKHTHAIDGSKVEHVHVLQNNPDDDHDPIEVVEMMGHRYKKSKAVATGDAVKLDVHNVISTTTADTLT